MNEDIYKDLFAVFKKSVEKWVDYFGLHDWRVEVKSDELEDGSIAECRTNVVGKSAYLVLNKDLREKDQDIALIEKSGFHEVCELLLAELYYQAYRDGVSEARNNDIAQVGHSIVRRLENTIYVDLMKLESARTK